MAVIFDCLQCPAGNFPPFALLALRFLFVLPQPFFIVLQPLFELPQLRRFVCGLSCALYSTRILPVFRAFFVCALRRGSACVEANSPAFGLNVNYLLILIRFPLDFQRGGDVGQFGRVVQFSCRSRKGRRWCALCKGFYPASDIVLQPVPECLPGFNPCGGV